MKEIKLDDRLTEIVRLLEKDKIYVDVGCDHGYVANFIVEKNIAKFVYATDISLPSLKKNEELALERGNSTKIVSLYGDGLNPVKDNDFDGAIIAGMGGELIISILNENIELIKDKILVLQPMSAARELRKFLYSNNLGIETESMTRDGNKFYEIIKVMPGAKTFSTTDFYFGENLVNSCDKILMEYIRLLIDINNSALDEVNISNNERALKRKSELEKENEIFKRILNECKNS